MTIIETANFMWLIYGNKIYYSVNNTCFSENIFLSYLMLTLLIFGYFYMMLYSFIFGILFFILYLRFKDKSKKKIGSMMILKGL